MSQVSEYCKRPDVIWGQLNRIAKRCRACVVCGVGFYGSNPQHKTCSKACHRSQLVKRNNTRRNMIDCPMCGNAYRRRSSTGNTTTTCSMECFRRGRAIVGEMSRMMTDARRAITGDPIRVAIARKCRECGGQYVATSGVRKYCGGECVSRFTKRRALRRSVVKGMRKHGVGASCRMCGEWFSYRKRSCGAVYCSKRCCEDGNDQRRDDRLARAFVEEVSIKYLIARDGGRCQICGRRCKDRPKFPSPMYPTIGHIVPVSRGGEHSRRNTQLACFGCNSRKRDTSGGQMRLVG